MGCCGWQASDRPGPTRLRAGGVAGEQANEVLAEHRAGAESALAAAAGDIALCRVDGQPGADVIKHAEGRLAAMTEVRRRVRSAGTPSADAAAVVDEVLAAWRAGLAVALDRGGLWPAYRRGGVAELEALRTALGAAGCMPGEG